MLIASNRGMSVLFSLVLVLAFLEATAEAVEAVKGETNINCNSLDD